MLKDRLIMKEIQGSKMYLLKDDTGISAQLLEKGIREVNPTKALPAFVNENDVCLDIGANLGYYALMMSKLVGKNGNVHAFEPVPINYEILCKNVELNNYSNIACYDVAMGSSSGYFNFLLHDKSNCGKMLEGSIRKNKDATKVIKVNTITVDSFVEQYNIQNINFIRMDIEGYEYEVFKGMHKTLSLPNLKMLVEFHWPGGKEYSYYSQFMELLKQLYAQNFIIAKAWIDGKEYNNIADHQTAHDIFRSANGKVFHVFLRKERCKNT